MNDAIGNSRGCRGRPAPRPVLTDERDDGTYIEYWNCPKLFIPPSVILWHKIYQYHKEFPGATMAGINTQTSRFLQAYYHYTTALKECEEKKE